MSFRLVAKLKTFNDLTLNGIMALSLHYFTEFVYTVIVKQLLGLYLSFKIYF